MKKLLLCTWLREKEENESQNQNVISFPFTATTGKPYEAGTRTKENHFNLEMVNYFYFNQKLK